MLKAIGPGVSLGIGLAVALFILCLLIRARWHYLAIPAIPGEPNSPARAASTQPNCMVVIPARNEEGVIGRAVRSLPPDTVIVVDDHSTDQTAEEARKAGAGVLAAPQLPRGAIGKSHACAAGARILVSRWILFADADARFESGFLNAVTGYAEANAIAYLSVYLEPEYRTWAERILAPLWRALQFSGANPRRDPAALFNGQCLLVRRDAYEFLGGHGAVTGILIEDVKLASIAQRHRLKLGVARAPHLGHVGMPAGYSGIRDGFERHAFRYMLVSPWIGAGFILTVLSLALWAPALALLVLTRQPIPAVVLALLPMGLLWAWYPNQLAALLSPLAIYGLLPIIWRGFFSALSGRRIHWKGRVI